jgi:hypothetical protein
MVVKEKVVDAIIEAITEAFEKFKSYSLSLTRSRFV